MQRNPEVPYSRRPPAHLPVSLRQDDPTSPIASSFRKTSEERNNARENIQTWFDRSNMSPAVLMNHEFEDSEPPYFLRQKSSSTTSNVVSGSGPLLHPNHPYHHRRSSPDVLRLPTNGSSANDFRSVIDDLTVENKRLKERLRKYVASSGTHLEKDVLFEVKIHGLPPNKKRELEETLLSFAATIDGSSDTSSKITPTDTAHHALKKTPSYSISRPVDSAYSSLSNAGPASPSTPNRIVAHRSSPKQQINKGLKIQSCLHDIPVGLPPKHSMVMTETQKKKIVVRRLEQLFTGKEGFIVGDRSQSLQQQAVSESAAMADRAANSKRLPVEGVREAQILPYEMEIDSKRLSKLADGSIHESNNSRGLPVSSADCRSDHVEQRPTRPLDLDPDRAQIPSDNLEYVRHLGIFAPNVERDISGDVEVDSDGWIYLNLLVNMAQLHIINVTPDFVRSAVAGMSDNFQVSRDGRKLRWRGGTNSTHVIRRSDATKGENGSPISIDNLDEADWKRRKIDAGRFTSVPIGSDRNESPYTTQHHPLHYKPLFHHQEFSSEELTSYGGSESSFRYGDVEADVSETGKVPPVPCLRSRGWHPMSGRSPRRGKDGAMVFYSGMQFCTDLSGDRGMISTPLHEATVHGNGGNKHTQGALGCISTTCAPHLSRTLSGSSLPLRPFKDYSRDPDCLQNDETRPKSDVFVDEESDFDFPLEWSSISAPAESLMDFSASGLGATQPADHFVVRVETRRTILDNHTQAKVSKFSKPDLGLRKFFRTVSKSPLETFQRPERANSADIINSGLACLNNSSPSEVPQAEGLRIHTEIVSAQFYQLQPSTLPAPLGCFANSSSSESDSDDDSDSVSFCGISHLHGQ